jgi:hypothetical protein
MIYTCRCTDGPARGQEFEEYGPPVAVKIPCKGSALNYRLVSVLDRGCVYRFCDPADEWDPLSDALFAEYRSNPFTP